MRAKVAAVLALLLMVPGAAVAVAVPTDAADADNNCGLDHLRCLAALYVCTYAILADANRLGDCLDRLDAPGADEVCRVGFDAESISRCSLRVVVCLVASAVEGGACTA